MSHSLKELQILSTIRKNQRFATHKALYKGQIVFVKQTNNEKLADSIRKEAWGMQTFKQLEAATPFPFSIPEVILAGEDFLVTSWADGKTMAMNPQAKDYLGNIDFLAESYAAIDNATLFAKPRQSKWSIPKANGQTTVTWLEDIISKLPYSDFLDAKLVKETMDRLKTNVPKLHARLTHADFTPNNVIVSGDKKILIDYESTSFLWPRFYDVVNCTFNRIVTSPELANGMTLVVKKFFTAIGEDPRHHTDQLNTVAMLRAISIVAELMTEPNEVHNTSQTMTPEIAARLSEKMERMLGGELFVQV